MTQPTRSSIPLGPPTAASRALPGRRALAALSGLVALAGCGYYFGVEEDPLEGDRIPVRQVASAARVAESAVTEVALANLPAPRAVSAWTQDGGGANRVLGNVEGDIALERLWSTSIGAGSDSESRVTAAPVAADGRIYALDAAAQITAVSMEGQVVWRADLTPEDEDGRDGFGGGLAIAGDLLIATTGFGEVVGLKRADGERLWTYKAPSPIRSAPAVAKGLAVFVTGSGLLAAVDISNGAERWRVAGIDGGAAMLAGSAPAISGEVVAAPFASGDLGIYRLSDGRRGWSEMIGGARRGSAMSLVTDISSSPVLYEGLLLAGGVAGNLVAYDIPSGQRVWIRDFGAYNRVWPAGRTVFVLTEDSRLVALDLRSGETIWDTQLPRYDDPEDREGAFAYGGPILVGGKLYVTSTDEKILRIDAATGERQGEADLPDGSAIPPISLGGRLYALDVSGDLHAYR